MCKDSHTYLNCSNGINVMCVCLHMFVCTRFLRLVMCSLWRGLYCCHERASQPKELWEEVACSLNQQNICLEDHIKYLKEVCVITHVCVRVCVCVCVCV